MEYIVTDQMRAWATANGFNADEHVDYFNDYLANKTGKPYKDLDAAFRQCVRSDWGRIRAQKRVNPLVNTKAPEVTRTTGRTVNGAVWVAATDTEEGYWKRA